MKKIIKYIGDIYTSFINEAKIILSDFDIFLVASFAILIYGFIYSYSYSPEILQKVPIAFVDMDNSTYSRELYQKLQSTQNINVKYSVTSMEEAKELMLDREVNGIFYIKHGFANDINSNKTAYFSVYCDLSYFLAYKQFFMAVNLVMLDMNKDIKLERYLLSGKDAKTAEFLSQPVNTQSEFLYNKYEGYGSFLMPAILILIIQQTILLACGMVFGKIRETNSLSRIYQNSLQHSYSASSIVFGRSIFYVISNLFTWWLVMAFIYYIFELPANGNIWEIFALIIPYILSSAFLGIGLSTLLKYKESSILYIFFSSLPFLLLSGISWPQQGMSDFWIAFSKLIPSTSAIDGFVRMQTMGASIDNVYDSYITLWILTFVYFVFAVFCFRIKITKKN